MSVLTLQPGATEHGNCVVLGRHGVLIFGAAGSGKSMLCDALLKSAHAASHYSNWVADDRVGLSISSERLLARPAPSIAGQFEVHHLGIASAAYQAEAIVDLVVEMCAPDKLDRMPEPGSIEFHCQETGESIKLPRLEVPERSVAVSLGLVHNFLERGFS